MAKSIKSRVKPSPVIEQVVAEATKSEVVPNEFEQFEQAQEVEQYEPTPFEKVYGIVVRNNRDFRYGNETLTYFQKIQSFAPRGADDLAKQIWKLIGGDKLGDGFIAQYLFKLATQQLDRVLKALVEYARVKFGEKVATLTDGIIEQITKIPYDEFIVQFEEILKTIEMTKWQRFVWWVAKLFKGK